MEHFSSQRACIAGSFIVLAAYWSTLSPSIAGGDSGELVAEGCILGTSHPPGYPLLSMIIFGIRNITLFPRTSIAYRVNAFSSICTATAAACTSRTVYNVLHLLNLGENNGGKGGKGGKEKDSKWFEGGGHLLTLGLFSFSPLIWQYAVTAEVFPLNTLFSALIVLILTQFAIEKQERLALLYLGLGLELGLGVRLGEGANWSGLGLRLG
jgi:hypothetical protein